MAPELSCKSTLQQEQIVQAIRSVATGLTVFDSVLAPQSSEDDSPVEQLTPREAEVLQLLAEGLGNKDIAIRLSISEHTIKFHIRSILESWAPRHEPKPSRGGCGAA